jgi:hypothetical protein
MDKEDWGRRVLTTAVKATPDQCNRRCLVDTLSWASALDVVIKQPRDAHDHDTSAVSALVLRQVVAARELLTTVDAEEELVVGVERVVGLPAAVADTLGRYVFWGQSRDKGPTSPQS